MWARHCSSACRAACGLTAAGEVFLAYARQAISELKAVESQVEQLRGLVRGHVSVAAVESVASELLPAAISQLPDSASQCPIQRPHRSSLRSWLPL